MKKCNKLMSYTHAYRIKEMNRQRHDNNPCTFLRHQLSLIREIHTYDIKRNVVLFTWKCIKGTRLQLAQPE